MRVVCLVPSLTEALLECGVEVVGRTRFCVHPAEAVADIQVVGGTKEVDWEACSKLCPDLVILDREENTREMAAACPLPWSAVHITSVETVGPELERLAREVASQDLARLGADWVELAQNKPLAFSGWDRIPGVWSQLPGSQLPCPSDVSRLEYVIWRKPWMAIGPGTFIESMLRRVGLGEVLAAHASRYQELSEADMNREDTFYLFSSEPYPFAEKEKLLASMGVAGAIVDGESYSWYGPRSYRFLAGLYAESVAGSEPPTD